MHLYFNNKFDVSSKVFEQRDLKDKMDNRVAEHYINI